MRHHGRNRPDSGRNAPSTERILGHDLRPIAQSPTIISRAAEQGLRTIRWVYSRVIGIPLESHAHERCHPHPFRNRATRSQRRRAVVAVCGFRAAQTGCAENGRRIAGSHLSGHGSGTAQMVRGNCCQCDHGGTIVVRAMQHVASCRMRSPFPDRQQSRAVDW